MYMTKDAAEIAKKQVEELKRMMRENMGINKKLFDLGNDVVDLRQKIDKEFPVRIPGQANPVAVILTDLLQVINDIRFEIMDKFKEKEGEKRWWSFNILCNEQELLVIKEQMDTLDVCYELLKKE